MKVLLQIMALLGFAVLLGWLGYKAGIIEQLVVPLVILVNGGALIIAINAGQEEADDGR